MSKEGTLLTIGVLTALAPFLGLPDAWWKVILPLFGIAIVIVAYLVRKDRHAPPAR